MSAVKCPRRSERAKIMRPAGASVLRMLTTCPRRGSGGMAAVATMPTPFAAAAARNATSKLASCESDPARTEPRIVPALSALSSRPMVSPAFPSALRLV